MFFIPFILYSVLAAGSPAMLSVTFLQLSVLIISALLFSYAGNVFSLMSIRLAPNPGYSLVVSKSYVLLTALASVFLFRDTLTLPGAIAIACIIGFSPLVILDPGAGRSGRSGYWWLVYAIGSFFCWGFLAIASKYLILLGVAVIPRLWYITGIVSGLVIGQSVVERKSVIPDSKTETVLLIFIGILSAVFNYFMQEGFRLAPNIGYVNAVNASSIAAVTVLAAIFFGDDFSLRKMAGVAGIIAGLFLLML
ncbi:hypothetical protein A2Z33_02435 [Candidatus Gottesmanbacteria bacterium RBG_16_52_11]|uniref:EamA domain-containing protein n=1 Tax=Candidatus Gottesmanbacteria bacterium RBG_16_52_11 TaxID=1798374 RepID=A0A1F5YMG9_9BACT|nr:MAG: hypothetical protein A2Z33_02435 [Candidatus Gottesmanbacteria bacterium RBG_16_52_11]